VRMSLVAKEQIRPSLMVAEHQTIVSESLANLLRAEFKQHVILECGDNLVEIERNSADLKLVVLTRSMLLSVCERSKYNDFAESYFGSVPVALLGDAVDENSFEMLERSNLKGVFPDETHTSTLIAGLKFILEGGQYFPRHFGDMRSFRRSGTGVEPLFRPSPLASGVTFDRPWDATNPFTRRERSVLECLATGQPNKVIAARLEIAENTIKIHIRNILKKLSVTNRTEAVLAAHRMGLVEIQ
jgi:DNA-binding NarL/FixJ family response regulator